MNLSKNFTLDELIATRTGLPNHPDFDETAKLIDLCSWILQPIRDKWGPLHIDSGFRSEEVNRAVGGSATSQHRLGEAADFVPLNAEIDKVFEWIVDESGLNYGQAILELSRGVRWVHISLPREGRNNKQALVYDGIGYHTYKR